MTQRGKERLVYHDYTYYKQSRTRNGFRWGCTKNRWHRCKAYLHLADDLTIVRSNMEHTHSPHAEYITMCNGKTLLLLKGYTFNKNGQRCGGDRWQCSSRLSRRCTAYVIVSSDSKTIIRSKQIHNHGPAALHMGKDGRYVKL